MGNQEQQQTLHNICLLQRLQDVERFDDDDQEMIIKMIDAMIVKH